MRKLLVIVLAVAVVGCGNSYKYRAPDEKSIALGKRLTPIGLSVYKCLPPLHPMPIHLGVTSEKTAYLDNNEFIVLSYGMFDYNDDVLRFIIAHEVAHHRLGHSAKRKAASIVTTGAMMVAGFFVPGAGLFNHAVNPAVVNNFSKSQELEADIEAAKACYECLKMTREQILKATLTVLHGEGGFWSTHPPAADRIINIEQYLNSKVNTLPRSPAESSPAPPPLSGKASGISPSP